MGLNGLLGFKGPTHLMPTQTHPFDTPNFNKICVFCDKCYVCIDKYVFIVIKIKCVNSGRICDICDKVNFTTKLHTFYNT
jgi:hypothetical protein